MTVKKIHIISEKSSRVNAIDKIYLVSDTTKTLILPVLGKSGYSEMHFLDSGKKDSDGIEVWESLLEFPI